MVGIDLTYFVVIPVVLSAALGLLSCFRDRAWLAALVCLVPTAAFTMLGLASGGSLFERFSPAVLVLEVVPAAALFLAWLVWTTHRKPAWLLLIGPLSYWLAFVVTVNVYLALGYRL